MTYVHDRDGRLVRVRDESVPLPPKYRKTPPDVSHLTATSLCVFDTVWVNRGSTLRDRETDGVEGLERVGLPVSEAAACAWPRDPLVAWRVPASRSNRALLAAEFEQHRRARQYAQTRARQVQDELDVVRRARVERRRGAIARQDTAWLEARVTAG